MDTRNEIFEVVRQLPLDERETYLNEACADDFQRNRVLDLLRESDEADAFFETGPLTSRTPPIAIAPVVGEKAGDAIGPYTLRQRLGEGGFGVVWMAEQRVPISRMIALKVVKAGMDSQQVLARFEAERQALAMMDHPNIAKVLDAGATDSGRPYFAMELVKGIPITDYCDEAGLSTNERLVLFNDLCAAIQHAHQKSIIHRDIKPSNVMVTLHGDKPVVKVIDFGIAKATQGKLTDQTLFTRFEQLIGTPVYMSPEQAALSGLDIDTRSDIYALGVLLYELLTGSPPFDPKTLVSAGYDEMRRIIREDEPPKPSSRLETIIGEERATLAKSHHIAPDKLNRLVASDLDWIVMKAIDKDRTRRYDTANAFAADIGRFLTDEPVSATPPSKTYIFRKFARRNKAAFRVAATIAAVLIAATLISTWQAIRATKAEERASTEKERAVSALDELRTTAPAFASQARSLAAKEQFSEAIEKLDYAIKLRPDAPEYLVAKADLLQCQLELAEAAATYREALRLNPNLTRAEESAKLCDELLPSELGGEGKLTRESLARLLLAMQRQQRPTAELMPVARLLGEEKKLVVDYWLERLKDLPISPEKPLKDRLKIADVGRLTLDLSGTKVADLEPLRGMPVGWLNLKDCRDIMSLDPLEGAPLRTLYLDGLSSLDEDGIAVVSTLTNLKILSLDGTSVTDLSPLKELHSLESLGLKATQVSDLAALRGMQLKQLDLRDTRVSDLSPLTGMPLTHIDTTATPATDYSPLTGAPLEHCMLQNSPLIDLSFLRDSPVKELSLLNCNEARGYAVLAGLKSLNLLILPQSYRNLPEQELAAIRALRANPVLRSIDTAESRKGAWIVGSAQPKEAFWKIWDAEQAMTAALTKSGIEFKLTPLTGGNYRLEIRDQPLRDISFIKDQPITELILLNTKVTDLGPLGGLAITFLELADTPVIDLSPLKGMPIMTLNLKKTKVTDLSPLEGMPLNYLNIESTTVADLSVLRGMPLTTIELGDTAVTDLSPLHGMALTDIRLFLTQIADLSPLMGMPIENLHLGRTPVNDISALRGMPLTTLRLHHCAQLSNISALDESDQLVLLTLPPNAKDIEFLRTLPKLKRLNFNEDGKNWTVDKTTKEFWKEYDAK